MTWLVLKHFICDFPLQMTPWMYRNKGTYGHIGGLAHAGIHGVGAAIPLLLLAPQAWWLCLFDAGVHYHVDYAKVHTCKRFNLRPDNSEWYWVVLGVDQLLHYATYIAMVAWAGLWAR